MFNISESGAIILFGLVVLGHTKVLNFIELIGIIELQIVIARLRGESSATETYESIYDNDNDESLRGMNDPDWDMWEEWMGWEGAGIRDYSSHINPYI